MVEKVVALENPVMLDHPVVRLRDKGLQYHRRHVSMIEAAKRIANVMQQSADDVLVILTRLGSTFVSVSLTPH